MSATLTGLPPPVDRYSSKPVTPSVAEMYRPVVVDNNVP
jgi:hypothetical protein